MPFSSPYFDIGYGEEFYFGFLTEGGLGFVTDPDTGISGKLLATYIELQETANIPLYPEFSDVIPSEANVLNYTLQAGLIPQNIVIQNHISGWRLYGLVNEMDLYVPAFIKPPGFTYDTVGSAFGNYATYGSSLVREKTFGFTIRANLITMDILNNTYYDKSFCITIENNYSSDRDSALIEVFSGQNFYLDNIKYTNILDYLEAVKAQGYYG